MATNPKEDYFSSLHKRNTISSRAKLGDKEKDPVPPPVVKDRTKQPLSDKNKECVINESSATASNLNLAALFREKLLIDESKEPQTSTDCVRLSRCKTLKSSSSKETNSQDARDVHRSKLRKSRPRSLSRNSIQSKCSIVHDITFV